MKLLPALSASVFFLASWIAFLLPAQAASLYIDPGIHTLNRGDSVTMSVRLDTNEELEECVNAVDGVIEYTSNIEPVDISIGESILNIWVEQPKINRENRTITFAGGIPNGYCGRIEGDPRLTNVLTKIVFRSPGFSVGGDENGRTARITFSDESTVYLNDGKGTKAPLSVYGATIDLNPNAGATMLNSWKDEVSGDKTPPEDFAITLVKGDGNFSDKYYVVFNTTDKQTGIDHYEIMEEPLTEFAAFEWGRADAPWKVQRSPYQLSDQSLNSIIRVKAIDKAGNEYIANLIPDEGLRTVSQARFVFNSIVGAGVLMVVIITFLSFRYYRRVKARNVVTKEDENSIDYD